MTLCVNTLCSYSAISAPRVVGINTGPVNVGDTFTSIGHLPEWLEEHL